MNYPSLTILTLVSCLFASTAGAATLFTIGATGTAANTNNFPAGEPPASAIDGVAATKYLNFGKVNTGYIFTLTSGTATATGINFTTANDAPDRDPASYRLFGSNTATASTTAGTIYDDSNFTQISTGALSLPATRLTAGGNVTFASATAYRTFLLLFPTVKNAGAANSMQIGEAMIQTAAGNLGNLGIVGGGQIPEPSALGLLFLGAFGLITKRRRLA